jgi:hypothetical protein
VREERKECHKNRVLVIKMFRVTKIDSEDDDRLPLDLILFTPPVETAWATREKTNWAGEDLWVVYREGLMAMKSLRYRS